MKRSETKSKPEEIQCWGHNPQAQMLRLELHEGSYFLFPYTCLECAHFFPSNGADILELSFGGQSVQIKGHNLREVGTAMQKMAVEWIKEISERYKPMAGGGDVFVVTIQVKAEREATNYSQTSDSQNQPTSLVPQTEQNRLGKL